MEDNFFNLEAEEAVLGTIIYNNEFLTKVFDFLKPEHFYSKINQSIFEKILELTQNKILANQITLKQFFDSGISVITSEGKKNGSEYLRFLLISSSSLVDIREYGKIIINNAKRRDLNKVWEDLKGKPYSEVINALKLKLDDFEDFENNFVPIQKAVSDVLLAEKSPIINLGIASLDKALGGLEGGNLIILAGRPSMGKTTFSLNLAIKSSLIYPTAFFSLEVTKDSVARKVISNLRSYSVEELKNKLPLDKVQKISNDDFFRDSKLLLDDEPKITVSKIRRRIKGFVKKGLKIVFIDYLGLIPVDKKSWSKADAIENIVNEIKAIAKEFNIVVVLLSQLSRNLEGRTSHRPLLSDLRDSGAIEQTADIVLFVHREEYYLSKKKPFKAIELADWQRDMNEVRGKSQIIIAKNRDGECGEVEFYFDGRFNRFTEIN